MADAEKFNLIKFFGSFFQLVPWVKTIRYVLGALGFGFIGLTIYRAYLMPTTKQITHIIAQPGAQVTVAQNHEEKKSRFSVHPFVEGYGFVESDNHQGVGAKGGVRVDF